VDQDGFRLESARDTHVRGRSGKEEIRVFFPGKDSKIDLGGRLLQASAVGKDMYHIPAPVFGQHEEMPPSGNGLQPFLDIRWNQGPFIDLSPEILVGLHGRQEFVKGLSIPKPISHRV
jgi:hypothetical protein